jgi:branched-chain amino acid transport system ATP-binding protein
MTTTNDTILELQEVHTYYGSIEALKGISLEVREGEIVTLIGSNGAGKSTTLRSINGLNHPRQGAIRFRGRDITNESPHDVVKMGIAQSPEGRRLFPRMSVFENLEMGAFQRTDRRGIREDMNRVFELFPRLQERRNQKAGTLSGGEQTIVEVNTQGTPILLVEQNALMALDVASRGYVLETGKIALADDAKALRENEDVRKTYLGEQ